MSKSEYVEFSISPKTFPRTQQAIDNLMNVVGEECLDICQKNGVPEQAAVSILAIWLGQMSRSFGERAQSIEAEILGARPAKPPHNFN